HKILIQEFLQVAHLSPSTKHDESARNLLEMEKVIKHEIEEISGKIYVEVESKTTPGQYNDKLEVLVGSENEDDISNESNKDTDSESNNYNNNDD
ncbi:10437_t:CDS:2, partial [Racocetra persica]